MKKSVLLAVLSVMVLANASSAFAISHKYREQLARTGHTQVEDANGAYKPRSAVEDADAVINCDIGHAADYLLSQGWKPNNGDWHKGSYTLRLVVENGKVLNAQVM